MLAWIYSHDGWFGVSLSMYLLNSMRNSVLFWFFSGGFRSLQYILTDRDNFFHTPSYSSSSTERKDVFWKDEKREREGAMPNNKAVLPRRDERIAVFIKLICQQALRNWQREQSVRSFLVLQVSARSKSNWNHHCMQMTCCLSVEMLNIYRDPQSSPGAA